MGGIGIKALKELLPEDFINTLYEIYSITEVDNILRSYITGRYTTFRVNKLSREYKDIFEELRLKNIKYHKVNYFEETYYIKNHNIKDVKALNAYKDGKIYLQNLSSIIPAILLNPKEDDKVLDMCAAPGGKTIKLSEIMNNKGIIVANDINQLRVERLKYNLNKMGVANVNVINSDARRLVYNFKEHFDKILLDAPCSGEGTIMFSSRKKIKLLNNQPFSKLQKELIKSAYKCLKPGGELIYSTCTISPKENEEVIQYLLEREKNCKICEIDIKVDKVKDGLVKYLDKKYNNEMIKSKRIIPSEILEGFYICKLKKLDK